MRDNELNRLLRSTLGPPIKAQFGPTVEMVRRGQPTQQGVPTSDTVFFMKMFDYRYGWTRRDTDFRAVPDPDDWNIPQTFTQIVETTFQISAFAIQNPNIEDQNTASDIVNYVAMLLSTDAILSTLRNGGANIYRIGRVGNQPFVDDFDNVEYSPTFDLVIQHSREITATVAQINSYDLELYPV